MNIAVQNVKLHLHNIRTRMPFRYGIAEMIALPHLFVSVECEIDGHPQVGLAADSLAPKWFTKDPNTSYRDDVAGMLHVIESAAKFAQQIKRAATVFDLWQQIYAAQKNWAATPGYPPLLRNFGVSLIERAVTDAFCRATGTSLAQALRANMLGIHLGAIHKELANYTPADLLPVHPLRSLIARHTVGLSDPLTDREITPSDRIHDGLPQSLEACIRSYGLTYFKIKVCGNKKIDVERLKQIAAVLGDNVSSDFAFTLDGNEQYKTVEQFKAMWQSITRDSELAPLLSRLLFVEQPFHRAVALSENVQQALSSWHDRPPIIIDESDSQLDSLPTALGCGYVGTSHKNCKGIFKGIANACLLEYYRRSNPNQRYVLSGEDLTNIGPVALLQDLAVMANLGVRHIERNGHHYFAGLSMFPRPLQEQVLLHHPDLYHRHEQGFVALTIHGGTVAVGSAVDAPFGLAFNVNPANFTPLSAWKFDSMNN